MKPDRYFRGERVPTPRQRRRLARLRGRSERVVLKRASLKGGTRNDLADGMRSSRGDGRWSFTDRKLYVDSASRKRVPAWVLPVVVTLLLALLVFFVAPYAVQSLERYFRMNTGDPGHPAVRILGENTRLVRTTSADVLDRPDLRATRITQALYNTPVVVDPTRSAYGYSAVRLPSGTLGFIANEALTDQRDSAEPYLYQYKLVVSDRMRRVMSHASQGTLLQEVMMGTVLYSDFRGDGIYRVALPDGGTGWIGRNGLIELGVDENVRASDASAFVSSAMGFLNMTYLPGGTTQYGIDSIGLIQVSAAVNGVDLPRTLSELVQTGTEVPMVEDEETGTWSTAGWRSGDVLVFHASATDTGGMVYTETALYVGEGQVLLARPSRSSIRLVTLTDDPTLLARVAAVRRLFASVG